MTTGSSAAHELARVHVERWGSGTPMLLIHGGGQGDPGGGQQKWKLQRPLAERGFELILPDRPGMGTSPAQGPDDFELDGPWAAELLGDGAHLVAHSYGGMIALCAARLAPQAVRSLTLVEAPVFSIAAHRPEVQQQVAQINSAMTARIPLVGVMRAAKALGIPRDRELRERPPLGALREMSRGFRTMRPPGSWDAAPALESLRATGVPVLYVEGGWSPGFRAVGEELTRLTGGELLTIPAGHHILYMHEGGRPFNAALERFVASAPPSNAST